MASTTFVDGVTVIEASWLNDVNTSVYTTVPGQDALIAAAVATANAAVPSVGNSTIDGIKTFSSSPLVPTPAPLDNSTKGASTAYVDAAVAAAPSVASGNGQCFLSKVGANIVLTPYNGNKIMINGVVQSIPSAGVSLAPTGLTPSTLYYVYAYMVGSTMTLEAVTTIRATSTTTGVEIKSGDPTRTLVGIVRPITGPAFADTEAQRFVLSWFNRYNAPNKGVFTANRAVTSATFVEVNSEIRNEFLCWSNSLVTVAFNGFVQHAQANGIAATSLAFDGISPEDVVTAFQAYTAGGIGGNSLTIFKTGLSEGFHYSTVVGYQDVGTTGSWLGGSAPLRCTLRTTVSG